METPIRPDQVDFEAIEREYGTLSPEQLTDDKVAADRYRLAQAHKLLRIWKEGNIPRDRAERLQHLSDMASVKGQIEAILGTKWEE